MKRRDLIFVDAKSSKFWSIVLDGSSHTVTYGRTGTDGQTKTKDFDSDDKAEASFEKLLKQKLSKGYVEGTSADAEVGDDGLLPATAFMSINKSDDLNSNAKQFIGKKVVDYDMEKGPRKGAKSIYRFRTDWDQEQPVIDQLQHFLDTDAAAEATGIVLGLWDPEGPGNSSADAVKILVDNKKQLPNLAAVYVGDIISEETEMSWIVQSDMTPLLKAFPDLQVLRIRGGEALSFKKPAHKNLRALTIETGGMSVDVVRSIAKAKFPSLEHLELWLGTEMYGGSSSVQDLQPFLSGKLFPNLKYLGLRNCDYVDDIAGVVVNSPVVEQIETLDLSLGVLTDVGANALLSLSAAGKLRKVNVHYNYVSKPVLKKLKDLKITVDASKSMHGEDDDWRFVAVGE